MMAKRSGVSSSLRCALVLSTFVLVAVDLAGGEQTAAAGGGGCGYSIDAAVVRKVVQEAIDDKSKPGMGAALIRLLFHDCWVNGCDGSVLLDSRTGQLAEKNASKNIGLRGFDVIDRIKAKIPYASCADIVVFAAREAAFILSRGEIYYDLTPCRRDGVNSSADAADANLPGSGSSFKDLAAGFAARDFTVEELVVLSGAHAVGVCHLSSFKDRLGAAPAAASEIDPRYQAALKIYVGLHKTLYRDPESELVEKNNIRDMDAAFQTLSGYNSTGVDTAAGVLDNSYYSANRQNMVLLHSDWVLRTGAEDKLQEYERNAKAWSSDFGKAMAKLSNLKPAPGAYTEIRKSCGRTN